MPEAKMPEAKRAKLSTSFAPPAPLDVSRPSLAEVARGNAVAAEAYGQAVLRSVMPSLRSWASLPRSEGGLDHKGELDALPPLQLGEGNPAQTF